MDPAERIDLRPGESDPLRVRRPGEIANLERLRLLDQRDLFRLDIDELEPQLLVGPEHLLGVGRPEQLVLVCIRAGRHRFGGFCCRRQGRRGFHLPPCASETNAIDLPSGENLALRSWTPGVRVRLRVIPSPAATENRSPRAAEKRALAVVRDLVLVHTLAHIRQPATSAEHGLPGCAPALSRLAGRPDQNDRCTHRSQTRSPSPRRRET